MRKIIKPKIDSELVDEWSTPSSGADEFKSIFKAKKSYLEKELQRKSDELSIRGAQALVLSAVVGLLAMVWIIIHVVQ